MSVFRYTKLTHPDEIRILVLLGGSGEEPLKGCMITMRVSAPLLADTTSGYSGTVWNWKFNIVANRSPPKILENPYTGQKKIIQASPETPTYECRRQAYASETEYDALSYTWGDPTKTNELKIGDTPLPITKNLYLALRHLRRKDDVLRLWVDAVCIDQGNLQERNHQVHMMRMIFAQSSSVIVWLGETSSSAITTEKLLLDYNANMTPSLVSSGLTPTKSILSYPNTVLAGLRKLFSRPWWNRVWIIQEIVAAREIVVRYGNRTMPWCFLRHICDAVQLNEFRSHPQAQILRASGARNFLVLDSFRRHAGSMPLTRLIQCTRNYHASDPRDKLYALLGMASDVSPNDLVPDYKQPVESVFRGLVQFMIHSKRSLDIISSSRFALAAPGNPTWLPDWRVAVGALPPLHGDEVAGYLYRASGTTLATAAMLGPSGKESILRVQGVVVDKVDFLGGTCSVSQESLPTLRRWQYIAEQNLDEAALMNNFPWTIVAGKDNTGRKATLEFVGACSDFIQGYSSQPVQLYADAVTRAVMGRRFFITKRGRMGLGPADVQCGDRIMVFEGCSVPIAVRAAGDRVHALFVGETYTCGIMDGEVMDGIAQGMYKRQVVLLK